MDIETVPDTALWKPEPPKPRARKKDDFPPLYAHRPIVIGFGYIDDALNTMHIGIMAGDDEVKLISEFTGWLSTQDATLVTFNGRGFDVPVLGLRALRHGIPQHFNTQAHRKRYTEESHLDLFDALTEYGALGRGDFSLDILSQVIGLGGKNGIDGSMVAGLYAKGEVAKIQGYCACDVGRTSFLLFRYLLMRGRITIEQYRAAAAGLFAKCVEMKLEGVTFAADQKRLLLTEG
jgi:predicted PolB exonuclease-like 3'-5' exonuclease